ncbi:MAG TPA: hypothetical protein VKW08_07360 [Xanthobacteraceae bacterium]|nr:hypothetical protein [Xanthobacteraceae bacterium]
MRRANILILIVGGLALGDVAARAADSGPVIVLPGRNHLPVIVNGVDITGAVVEGDWGLYSPHMVHLTIIPAPLNFFTFHGGYYGSYVRGTYFPALGREPGYGRREIEPLPNRILPPPAPSFHRSWSSQSEPLPPDLTPPVQAPFMVAPQIYPDVRRRPKGP